MNHYSLCIQYSLKPLEESAKRKLFEIWWFLYEHTIYCDQTIRELLRYFRNWWRHLVQIFRVLKKIYSLTSCQSFTMVERTSLDAVGTNITTFGLQNSKLWCSESINFWFLDLDHFQKSLRKPILNKFLCDLCIWLRTHIKPHQPRLQPGNYFIIHNNT